MNTICDIRGIFEEKMSWEKCLEKLSRGKYLGKMSEGKYMRVGNVGENCWWGWGGG